MPRPPRRKRRPSLLGDLAAWLWTRRLWWLVPIILSLLVVAGLIALGGTAAAPFIYPLF